MSTRIGEDGKPLLKRDHLGVLRIREGVKPHPYHRPLLGTKGRCLWVNPSNLRVCGRLIYKTARGLRHEPDTFWTSR